MILNNLYASVFYLLNLHKIIDFFINGDFIFFIFDIVKFLTYQR